MLLKFQFGLTLPLAAVAEMKFRPVIIWAVVMPLPPGLVARPLVCVSQKLLVIELEFIPTRPPS